MDKYYKPKEIELSSTNYWKNLYKKIIEHELNWLLKMWCSIEEDKSFIITNNNKNSNKFTNRIYIKNGNWTKNIKKGGSVIINPLLCKKYEEVTKKLIEQWLSNTISSKVYWTEIKNTEDIEKNKTYILQKIKKQEEIDKFIEISMDFFIKKNEKKDDFKNRIEDNIKKGNHYLLYQENIKVPIWIIWTIKQWNTIAVYAFQIKNHYSTLKSIYTSRDLLLNELRNEEIKYVYLKTRNKAVDIIAERKQWVKFLYSEKIYE